MDAARERVAVTLSCHFAYPSAQMTCAPDTMKTLHSRYLAAGQQSAFSTATVTFMHFTLDAVISADMYLIGQLQPRAKVRFVRGDMDPSLAARADRIWMPKRLPKTLAWCQVGMLLGGPAGKTQPRLQTRGRSVDRLRCLPPLHFQLSQFSRRIVESRMSRRQPRIWL